ncbi:MAG: hypothetical protein PHQ40_08360 [Anaerolineaceae bacterium]|nr:hypothetical protein [Anaerolineaceae bacterium]
MAAPTFLSSDERGIDGSRMADYDYGQWNGRGRPAHFQVFRAYQEGRPWAYADYWKARKSYLLKLAHRPLEHQD